MRVLLIDVNCKSSSTGKIVYDLYSYLREQGHEAAICYGRGKLIEEPDIYRFSPQWEVYAHAALTRITGLTGCFSPIATWRLIEFIKKYKPDVIHIHELHAYFVNLKPLINYIKKSGIKTVWTFHCEYMYTGKCGVSIDCERWKVGCGNCPYLDEYVATRWFDFTHKMWKEKKKMFEGWKNLTIITPSQWLANRVNLSFLKGVSVHVVHNGVNTKVFHPREFEHLKMKHGLKDEKIVLAVAPDIMYERKGGHWVLKLAEMMADHNDIRFIMIGFKPEEIEMMKFPPNVIPLARTENQIELAEYYSMADIFVICSMIENYPTTCIEAIACGTPVCGFAVGGTAETFPLCPENFVREGDIDSLARVVQKNLNSDRTKVYSKYSDDDMCYKYIEMYHHS